MPDGIIVIHKPQDWTSMDVCAKLRGVFHEKRVGHAGTLDPMATGVLPVFVGQATKAVSFAEDGKKEYVARLRLGAVTDTQDTFHNYGGIVPMGLLDYVFVSEDVAPLVFHVIDNKINGNYLSDHYGVYVDLRLNG